MSPFAGGLQVSLKVPLNLLIRRGKACFGGRWAHGGRHADEKTAGAWAVRAGRTTPMGAKPA